ncbi:hypothetical protein NUU61_001207 [Penicillium alfredii]|uniref:Uncharacterized protein n=1 Tax=Penicillium alfredii TaxID=1506179 RepID=A0A9W9GB45_9EURO|nr:uncharacterized protein NUU61_001207 [Penicillium alfredii]KAJ5115448.1 hypothetical protein NUU61_001207 [Penicillium alfredii]
MTKETTPPHPDSHQPTTREPPSLPTSPLAKRTKTDAAAMTASTGPAIYTPEVTVVEELEESVRGGGGFGSTGA